jgi:hypothetical protein
MGGSSAATERYLDPSEFLRSRGIDLTTPEGVNKALSDPDLMKEAQARGMTRGAIIGAIDTLSGGVASKTFGGPLKNLAIQTFGLQPALGAAGEAAAGYTTEGDIDWRNVTLEALGGLATAPAEVAVFGTDVVKDIAKGKGKSDSDVTLGDVADAAEAGDTRAIEVLKAAGLPDEQIAALSPEKQDAFAARIETRQAEDQARAQTDPQMAPDGATRKFKKDQERLRAEALNPDIDPQARSTAGRTRSESADVMTVDAAGNVDAGDPGVRTAVDRNRNRPTTETAPVPLEPQSRPMTDEQITQARVSMDRRTTLPPGDDMAGVPDQPARPRTDMDRDIGAIRDEIGRDPVELVDKVMGLPADDFRRLSPDGRRRVVRSAIEQEARQGDTRPSMTTSDAAHGDSPYSPSSKPQGGAAQTRRTDRGRGQQPTDAEIDRDNPEYARISTGTSDRPFDAGFGPDTSPDQETFFRTRAEEAAEKARQEEIEKLEREWARRRASREDMRARNRANRDAGNYATEPGAAGPDGYWPVNDDGVLVDDEGKPVRFKSNRDAAVWAAGNKQGAYFDRVAASADTDEVYLRANDNYRRDKGASAEDGGPETPGPSEAPRAPEREAPRIGRRDDTPDPSGARPWDDLTYRSSKAPEDAGGRVSADPPAEGNSEPADAPDASNPAEYTDVTQDAIAAMEGATTREERISRANDFVRRRGAETGHEYLVAMNPDGSVFDAGTVNQANKVLFSVKLMQKLDRASSTLTVTHNHPASSSFSITDILALTHVGMHTIGVVPKGKNPEYAKRGPSFDHFLTVKNPVEDYVDGPVTPMFRMSRHLQTIERPLHQGIQDEIWLGNVDIETASLLHSQALSRVFHAVGIIDFTPGTSSQAFENDYVVRAADKAVDRAAAMFGIEPREFPENVGHRQSDGLRESARDRGLQEIPGRSSERGSRGPDGLGLGEDSGDRTGGAGGEGTEARRSAGPKLYSGPGVLFDPDVYRAIGRDLKALLKSSTSLTGAGARILQRIGRAVFSSADTQIRETLREDGLLSDTAVRILDMFYATPGEAGGVGQTFFEAIEERTGAQLQSLAKALGDLVDNANAMGQVVNLVRNPRNIPASGGTKAQRAARALREMLDEHLEYLRDSGVEIGEVKNGYFPRELDQAAILQNPAGFLKAAAKAYMETGMNRAEATEAARALHDEILFGHLREVGGNGVSAPFVRARTFGKSVDSPSHPLHKFLMDDPVSSLVQYINRSARRAEIAKRFGDNFKGMKDLEKALIDEDAGAAIEPLRDHIASMTGISNASSEGAIKWSQRLRIWGALMYLEKATLSSLGEVVMPAMRAGDLRAIGTSITETIKALRKKKPSEARAFAEDLGLIAGNLGESILSSRYAGADVAGQTQAKVLDRYFRRTGLEQWTEATRISAMQHGRVLLRRLAADVSEGGSRARLSRAFLQELGIADPDTFAKWLTATGDGMPSIDQIGGKGGAEAAYRTALARFVDQTIMKPNKATRPKWSNHPLGAVVFHLQSFTHAFYNQVVKRNGRMLREATGKGLSMQERARLAAPAAMMPVLFGLHALMSELRDEAFRSDESRDEETESQKFFKWMDRAGFFGPLSPILNLLGLSSRYQNSAVDLAIGPDLGAAGRAIDTMVKAATANNPKTNSTERATVKAIYDLGLEPGMNWILSRMGPGGVPVKAAITQIVGHHTPRDALIDTLAGPDKRGTVR